MSQEALPPIVPVFPLEGALLLPRGSLPLNIFEPRYLKLIEHALGAGRYMAMVQPTENGLQKIGCLGRITTFNELEEDKLFIALTGITRFRVARVVDTTTPYPQVEADYSDYHGDLVANVGALDVNREGVLDILRRYLEATNLSIDWQAIESAGNESLVNSLSIISPYGVQEKQALLEAESLSQRAEILIALTEMALAHLAEEKSQMRGNDNDLHPRESDDESSENPNEKPNDDPTIH